MNYTRRRGIGSGAGSGLAALGRVLDLYADGVEAMARGNAAHWIEKFAAGERRAVLFTPSGKVSPAHTGSAAKIKRPGMHFGSALTSGMPALSFGKSKGNGTTASSS